MNEDVIDLLERVLDKIDSEWLADYDKQLCDDIKAYLAKQQEKPVIRCSVCKTTENVEYVGGYHQRYLCCLLYTSDAADE